MKIFGPCGQLSSAKHLEIYLISIVNKTAIATVSCNKRKQRKKIENYHFKDFTSLLGHTKTILLISTQKCYRSIRVIGSLFTIIADIIETKTSI